MCFRTTPYLFRDTILKLIASPNLEYKNLTPKVLLNRKPLHFDDTRFNVGGLLFGRLLGGLGRSFRGLRRGLHRFLHGSFVALVVHVVDVERPVSDEEHHAALLSA